MAKISGISYRSDSRGRKRYVTIDLKVWGTWVDDVLDKIELEQMKESPDGEVVGDIEELKEKYEKKLKLKGRKKRDV